MGKKAKQIGKFNTDSKILDPKKLQKSDKKVLANIKSVSDITVDGSLRNKIIHNACDSNPFEFKIFNNSGLIDMKLYSYSEEPSFLILHAENLETDISEVDKKVQQEELRKIQTETNTSTFFSNLVDHYDTISSNNGECFIKLDVIPNNIDKLIELYIHLYPLDDLKGNFKEKFSYETITDDNKKAKIDRKLAELSNPDFYKACIKQYILSVYKTLDQVLDSCKNSSQKSFYIDLDVLLIEDIFFQTDKKSIDIIVHQKLSIDPKLSDMPFKKDVWMFINVQDVLLDGLWNSITRKTYSIIDYAPSLSTVWSVLKNWTVGWIITLNEISELQKENKTDITDITDITKLDFIKLKQMEDASRMLNIYKMTSKIICFENIKDNQISITNLVDEHNKFILTKQDLQLGRLDSNPMICLSQGVLFVPNSNCGDLTRAVKEFHKKYTNMSQEDKNTEISLNRFLEIGSSTITNVFKDRAFFTNSSKTYKLPNNVRLYKYMFTISDAKPEDIYSEISLVIDEKFKEKAFRSVNTRFSHYGSDDRINEKDENGTIQTIKGKSYFVTNGEYHELFTLSYPDFKEVPAENKIENHRALFYKKEKVNGLEEFSNIPCLEELEESRYINFSFNYSDFMTAINFTNTDSIKPTVKEFKIKQLDAYSRNEDVPSEP